MFYRPYIKNHILIHIHTQKTAVLYSLAYCLYLVFLIHVVYILFFH